MNEAHFGDLLKKFVEQKGRSAGWIARCTTGKTPKGTIESWLAGAVKKPRDWQQLLYVAQALELSRNEVDELLRAAGQPTITVLHKLDATRQNQALIDLLALWPESNDEPVTENTLPAVPIRSAMHEHVRAATPIDDAPGNAFLHLPFTQSYQTLIGRDALVNEILGVFTDPAARNMVGLDGMGGIGKTAIAHEVAALGWQKSLFDAVCWIGATGGFPRFHHNAPREGLSFEAVLNQIGQQLALSDLVQLPLSEKEKRIQTLLRRQPVLIVLDNLETAAEPQTEMIARLQPLLGNSKALLTSRQRFSGDFYIIHLDGLATGTVQHFIHQEAKARRINAVGSASAEQVGQIATATGGSPLALKLVVGQLGLLPLDSIIEYLQAVKPLESDLETDEYIKFYRYIYWPSWDLLSEQGKRLLISMSIFVPGVGSSLSAISATSSLPRAAVHSHIHELWGLSFLEVGQMADLNQKRYYLHTLTQNFVLSDIVKVGDHSL